MKLASKDDNKGQLALSSGAKNTYGQYTVRYYPGKGLVILDNYDFNSSARNDDNKYLAAVNKRNNG